MHLAAGGAIIWMMTDDKVKRRLTTVLCADVHGYSRLMEADEAGTLGTLRRYRTAIAGLVARHDGRIVNTWGDAVIAEFASVVEAVQCAVEIQQEISNQDPDPPQAVKRENWIDTLTLSGKSLQIGGGPSLPWQPAAKPLAVTSFKLSSAT